MIDAITIAVLLTTSVTLFAFGLNLLYLTWRSMRTRPPTTVPVKGGEEPSVCVQVPIFNERYVAERVIDAVCSLDWPRERFEVQLLDDSDDETVHIVSRRAARWRHQGVRVTHVRRGTREGFKAGALAHGLKLTEAPYIAIFDADFVPPSDFLRRTIGVFAEARVGFVQARWGHLNENYSWFTRLQALAIDFHFLVEQAVRSSSGYFTNFTGTAGVWRRSAIEDAGGWSAATLTEDLDLSYRAQLRGWRAAYLEDLVVPEELPVSIDAYRRQQSRWATGSFQSAFKLLVPVLASRNRIAVKLQAAVHLLAYGVGPVMLIQLACYPVLLFSRDGRGLEVPWQLADASIIVILIGVSPWIGFMVAQTRRGRAWWSGAPSLLCQLVGAGMSLNTLIALVRATRPGGEFVRTPKHRIVERGQEWRDQAYVKVGDPRAVAEAVLGLLALSLVPLAAGASQTLVAIYSGMFAVGFLSLAALSAMEFLEVVTLRSLGRRALARLQSAAPAGGLLLVCAALLLVATQMPEPFEDGYAHWLIAANLATTGHLHDPLFGMEDTWLPGYHVLAAAVLHVFGTWSLGALKVMGALLGLATLGCVYAIAPNRRQGTIAVALLALNPVFLFTSVTAVVEPLLTALLIAAALATMRGHHRLAALLAALAAASSTKAWIWFAAAAGLYTFDWARVNLAHGGLRRRIPAAAWGVPAIALVLLLLLQFGLAPVTNSIARGSVEALSAAARGSVPGTSTGRVVELATTYGLAALPLLALGLAGLVGGLRSRSALGGKVALLVLHGPSIVYLGAVFALVAGGAYTGSHRYLYPALPALALSASALLDRGLAISRVATSLAGALLAVGFLPVFAGFGAANAGLAVAGHATAGSPGVLITDSPVVAYYSGRPPAMIEGSKALPADPGQAIAWLGAHDVSDLVLEDISYYRATQVFPGLAAGQATAPFAPLGDQAVYQTPGGKQAYAYRFGAGLLTYSLRPGLDTTILAPPPQGKTAPLAKGASLGLFGASAAGEGMGFGVPIVHYADGWVYPRTATTVDESTPTQTVWKRTYELDEIGGDYAHAYAFVPTASRGRIEVTYAADAGGLTVSVRVINLDPGFSEVGILNEQSAAFDDFADPTQTLIGTSLGNWVAVQGPWARLRSASLGLEWSVPALDGAELHAGRELAAPGFDWAGLDYIFPASFTAVSYRINVQQAR